MQPESLVLTDHESVSDLHTYLARARTLGEAEARLQAAGDALAVYVPVLHPDTLGSDVPTILGLRIAKLEGHQADGVDAVYPLGALTDRLARMGGDSVELRLPPAEAAASWAGVAPPRQGWSRLGEYDDDALRAVADEGMRAVAAAVPDHSGKPVVATVRGRIWSSPSGHADLPAGAAFAAELLGFLRPGGTSVLFENGRWRRLSSAGGHVLVRLAARLG